MIHIIFILIRPFSDLSCPMDGDILEETTPIRIEMFHHRIKVITHNIFVLISSDSSLYSMVAEALVIKHPCLKEPGSQTGWYGWKNSLKFKMGNFRTKLSRAGFHEVAINSGKRSRNNPNKPSPHTNIKRPKRAEVNFLPNFPRGENAASLERLRLQIVDEVKKSDKNLSLIGKLMQTTFALRRNEIVSDDPPVDEILERWPALKMESQVKTFFVLHLFEQIYHI